MNSDELQDALAAAEARAEVAEQALTDRDRWIAQAEDTLERVMGDAADSSSSDPRAILMTIWSMVRALPSPPVS